MVEMTYRDPGLYIIKPENQEVAKQKPRNQASCKNKARGNTQTNPTLYY